MENLIVHPDYLDPFMFSNGSFGIINWLAKLAWFRCRNVFAVLSFGPEHCLAVLVGKEQQLCQVFCKFF